MSHFAEIDNNNIVLRVLVADNNLPNEGKDWLEQNLGGTWVQASYNTYQGEHLLGGVPLRKNFPATGYSYDPERDAFISPKPFDSWVLNENTCDWDAPTPMPNDGLDYYWDEDQLSWIETPDSPVE